VLEGTVKFSQQTDAVTPKDGRDDYLGQFPIPAGAAVTIAFDFRNFSSDEAASMSLFTPSTVNGGQILLTTYQGMLRVFAGTGNQGIYPSGDGRFELVIGAGTPGATASATVRFLQQGVIKLEKQFSYTVPTDPEFFSMQVHTPGGASLELEFDRLSTATAIEERVDNFDCNSFDF
jgi:hypothetical protein